MIQAFCDWLSATPISIAFQSAQWFVPFVQTVHIISISILLISVYVISFRLIGLVRGIQSIAAVTANLTPWIWSSLLVLLISGVLLTITEPARELLNWSFRVKMILVLVLSGSVLFIQLNVRRDSRYLTRSVVRARLTGVTLFVLGAAIVTAGRWIAYV